MLPSSSPPTCASIYDGRKLLDMRLRCQDSKTNRPRLLLRSLACRAGFLSMVAGLYLSHSRPAVIFTSRAVPPSPQAPSNEIQEEQPGNVVQPHGQDIRWKQLVDKAGGGPEAPDVDQHLTQAGTCFQKVVESRARCRCLPQCSGEGQLPSRHGGEEKANSTGGEDQDSRGVRDLQEDRGLQVLVHLLTRSQGNSKAEAEPYCSIELLVKG